MAMPDRPGLFPLRPLQQRAMDMLRDSIRSGKRHPVIQAPTGYGKTILAAHIVHGAMTKKNRVAFVVPLINLVDQTLDRFRQNGIDIADMGVMQGNHPMHRPNAPIQICSAATLAARYLPDVDFAVIDEVHIQYAVINSWLDANPKMIFVGLSATPWSRGMADHWDDLLIPATIGELIQNGDLCPFRVFGPKIHPDLAGVGKRADGDYREAPLSTKMRERVLVADVVKTWMDKAEWRPTLQFAVDRAHAAVLHDEFTRACVRSVYVDADTPRDERNRIRKAFDAKEIEIIVNIGTMTTGVDLDVRCISLCRPTRDKKLFVQMIGRGLRNAPGKADCLILDHTDSHAELGMVTDIYFDRLRGGKDEAVDLERDAAKAVPKPFQCTECDAMVSFSVLECPNCGAEGKRPAKPSPIAVKEGELVSMQSKRQAKLNRDWTADDKAEFYGELKAWAASKGYKPGWAANKYREKLGVWPNDPRVRNAPWCAPSLETRSWIRAGQIRRAKALEKAKDGVRAIG